MDENQFGALIELDEGASLEFKKSLSDADRIGQTISAFANTGGGKIVFGVHKQGKNAILAGIENTDKANQELQNKIFNTCRPEPRYSFDNTHYKNLNFVVLIVEAMSLSEVCSYKRTIWKRVGSVNIELSGDELVMFLKERGMLSFEELPSPMRIDDVDIQKVNKVIESRGTAIKEHQPINIRLVLESLGVATTLKELVIKKAAPLFFAKNIAPFQQNCEVRIVKYRGKEASLETKEEDIRLLNTLPELLQESFKTTMRFIGTTSTINEGRRQEITALPQEVVREALTNAIGHRDYIDPNGILIEVFDDRVQITSPGGLLPGQTLRNFAETRRHRNPIIHRLLNDYGWGEGLYFGIKAMYRLQRKNNLPDPEFYDLGGFFKAVLYTTRSDKKRKPVDVVNERQSKALAYVKKNKALRTAEYAKIVGVSKVTAVKDLNELVIQGKLRKIGKFRGVHYTKP